MTSVLYSRAMTKQRRSSSDVARERAAFRDITPGVIALVVIEGTLIGLDREADPTVWTVVWSLLPLLPVLWLVRAQLRSLQRADELQRVVQLEAMAIGFGATVLLALTGGLLDAADVGNPAQWLQITFIGGILVWIAALAVNMRRAQ